jgi:hypothetical protein
MTRREDFEHLLCEHPDGCGMLATTRHLCKQHYDQKQKKEKQEEKRLQKGKEWWDVEFGPDYGLGYPSYYYEHLEEEKKKRDEDSEE